MRYSVFLMGGPQTNRVIEVEALTTVISVEQKVMLGGRIFTQFLKYRLAPETKNPTRMAVFMDDGEGGLIPELEQAPMRGTRVSNPGDPSTPAARAS